MPRFLREGVITLVALGSTALMVANAARASDGVIEINQAKALAGGVTPGDAPGFPVDLNEPGSYRLTGDLTIDELTIAIRVQANDVTIDLGGFTIQGPNVCTGGPPPTCIYDNTEGVAVDAYDADARNVEVRNGVVRGMGYMGVFLGSRARTENLRAFSNGYIGIYSYGGSVHRNDTTAFNHGDGIFVFEGDSLITGNVSYQNATDGIATTGTSTISNNVTKGNGEDGIEAHAGSTVSDNVSANNLADGLNVTGSGYKGNSLLGNGTNIVGGVSLGPNLCNGTLCP